MDFHSEMVPAPTKIQQPWLTNPTSSGIPPLPMPLEMRIGASGGGPQGDHQGLERGLPPLPLPAVAGSLGEERGGGHYTATRLLDPQGGRRIIYTSGERGAVGPEFFHGYIGIYYLPLQQKTAWVLPLFPWDFLNSSWPCVNTMCFKSWLAKELEWPSPP